jgi:hypothetical protein
MKKSIFLVGSVLSAILFLLVFVQANTVTLRPDGQGYYSAWTNSGCSSGSSEWQCVDENPENTSDDLRTNSKSVSESFTFGNTGLSGVTINSVTLYFYSKYYSSSRYQFQPLIRASSTDYLGSAKSTTSSYASYSQVYTTNPATGSAWTIGQVDALEAGMKSYSSNYGGIVAQVYAVVDYSIPDSCSDTDGGNYPFSFGTTSGYFSNLFYSHNDYCVDSSNIMEFFCSGVYENSSQQSCGTDGYSSNFCYSGDVYNNYTDYNCASDRCYANASLVLQQDCTSEQHCTSGQCIWNNTCSDSDGGLNATIFGATSGYYNNSEYLNEDYCYSNSTLREAACSYGWSIYNYVTCNANGTTYCSNGVCV